MWGGRGLGGSLSSSDCTHHRAVELAHSDPPVLCQRVAQLIIHGRGIVSCTSEMQSVVAWKIAMAGPQERL